MSLLCVRGECAPRDPTGTGPGTRVALASSALAPFATSLSAGAPGVGWARFLILRKHVKSSCHSFLFPPALL